MKLTNSLPVDFQPRLLLQLLLSQGNKVDVLTTRHERSGGGGGGGGVIESCWRVVGGGQLA